MTEPKPPHRHPVSIAINKLIAHTRDIEECVEHFVAAAFDDQVKEILEVLEQFPKMAKAAETGKPTDGAAIRELVHTARRAERIFKADRARALKTSVFLGLFSAFDTFTGELVAALFYLRPEAFAKLGGDVPLQDVLAATSIESLKRRMLADRTEDIRRKSYIDQFETMERLFDIKLKGFEHWVEFVEISQRRNLFAHCGGLVSEQYLAVCRREGWKGERTVGEQLTLDTEYLRRACLVVAEVGVKLGQTLWRRLAPAELNLAEKHLHDIAYEALQFEEWEWSQLLGEFGLGQRDQSSEENRLITLVNLAIAFKYGGSSDKAFKLLEGVDWSAKADEFRLANAVLHENYDEAGRIMERLGQETDRINDFSYHDWPLFRDYRGTPQFLASYEKVYGRQFKIDVDRVLAEAPDQLTEPPAN